MKRLDQKQEELLLDLDKLVENHTDFITAISILKTCVTPYAEVDDLKRTVLETMELLENNNPNFNQ